MWKCKYVSNCKKFLWVNVYECYQHDVHGGVLQNTPWLTHNTALCVRLKVLNTSYKDRFSQWCHQTNLAKWRKPQQPTMGRTNFLLSGRNCAANSANLILFKVYHHGLILMTLHRSIYNCLLVYFVWNFRFLSLNPFSVYNFFTKRNDSHSLNRKKSTEQSEAHCAACNTGHIHLQLHPSVLTPLAFSARPALDCRLSRRSRP